LRCFLVAVQTLAAPEETSDAAANNISNFHTHAQHVNFHEAAISYSNGSIASWDVEAGKRVTR
jgi:hypothetical protein